MTTDLEKMSQEIFYKKVPTMWTSHAYASTKDLPSWILGDSVLLKDLIYSLQTFVKGFNISEPG